MDATAEYYNYLDKLRDFFLLKLEEKFSKRFYWVKDEQLNEWVKKHAEAMCKAGKAYHAPEFLPPANGEVVGESLEFEDNFETALWTMEMFAKGFYKSEVHHQILQTFNNIWAGLSKLEIYPYKAKFFIVARLN